jgi:hypothetical protein
VAYLYRAVDKLGNTIDFYLSPTRDTAAAKRFLGKALSGLKDWEKPSVINTDKAPTYAAALAELKKEGRRPWQTEAADPASPRLQAAENGLRDDAGLAADIAAEISPAPCHRPSPCAGQAAARSLDRKSRLNCATAPSTCIVILKTELSTVLGFYPQDLNGSYGLGY